MLTSGKIVSVGRILLAFCPALWDGAQPCIVVRDGRVIPADNGDDGGPSADRSAGPVLEGNVQRANVNVFVDAERFNSALQVMRGRADGNTIREVPIFDPLNAADRQRAADLGETTVDNTGQGYNAWCEWPAVSPDPASESQSRAAQSGGNEDDE